MSLAIGGQRGVETLDHPVGLDLLLANMRASMSCWALAMEALSMLRMSSSPARRRA